MRLSPRVLQTNRQRLLNAFPMRLRKDVDGVCDYLMDKNFDIHSSEQKIILDKEALNIPSRVYFDKPDDTMEKTLTTTQQTILNCLYLRHYNGFIRQRKLEKLVSNTDDYFIIPYVFALLGEYVIEILDVVDKHISDKTMDQYLRFFSENPLHRQKTEARMISYWNEYYRWQYQRFDRYIGKKIFDKIKDGERHFLEDKTCDKRR